MADLVTDPTTDLFSPIPHGTGQTILRDALLVADHNAYHLGNWFWSDVSWALGQKRMSL
jgi:hypothetical protein